MALKTKVKVGKITNLSDARYCAGMGVDFLGFPVSYHQPAIDLKNYQEITAWVSGPAFVIEWMGNEISPDFAEHLRNYNADYLEISARLLENLPLLETPLIVTLDIGTWNSFSIILRNNRSRITYLLLRSEGALVDHHLVSQIGNEFRVLLGFGVSEKNLEEIVNLPIAGIALEGTNEDTPGLKEYASLSGILEQLEISEG